MTPKIYLIRKVANTTNNRIYFFIYFVIFFLFMSEIYSQQNKILFKVNNSLITSIDILNEINYLKSINLEFSTAKNNNAFEIAKNSIIREKIKEIEILKFVETIKVDETLLNNIILNNFNYLNIYSNKEFNQYFTEKKIDPLLIKKKLSIEILWNQIIYNKFNKKIKINMDEIKNNLANEKQTELLLSEILFELNEGEKVDQKFIKIKKIINEESFNQAALLFSISETGKNGGRIGWLKDTTISKKILEQLKGIKKGDFSKPIVVPGGFLILKIENTREVEKNINLEKELKKIIQKKTNQQLNQFSNIYFNKIKKDILINEL